MKVKESKKERSKASAKRQRKEKGAEKIEQQPLGNDVEGHRSKKTGRDSACRNQMDTWRMLSFSCLICFCVLSQISVGRRKIRENQTERKRWSAAAADNDSDNDDDDERVLRFFAMLVTWGCFLSFFFWNCGHLIFAQLGYSSFDLMMSLDCIRRA